MVFTRSSNKTKIVTYSVSLPSPKWQFSRLSAGDLGQCRQVRSGIIKLKEFLPKALSSQLTSFSRFEIWSHNLRFSRREWSKSASARSNLCRNELFSAFNREISALPWRSLRSNCILKRSNYFDRINWYTNWKWCFVGYVMMGGPKRKFMLLSFDTFLTSEFYQVPYYLNDPNNFLILQLIGVLWIPPTQASSFIY